MLANIRRVWEQAHVNMGTSKYIHNQRKKTEENKTINNISKNEIEKNQIDMYTICKPACALKI